MSDEKERVAPEATFLEWFYNTILSRWQRDYSSDAVREGLANLHSQFEDAWGERVPHRFRGGNGT
jgi:hypothetical protein